MKDERAKMKERLTHVDISLLFNPASQAFPESWLGIVQARLALCSRSTASVALCSLLFALFFLHLLLHNQYIKRKT